MILVFDLDDTLYEEETYVRSGFQAVAAFLQEQQGWPQEESLAFMLEKLAGGRGRIFDDLLLSRGRYTKRLVEACVRIYRLHEPNLSLSYEGEACLRRFSDCPLYVVTDGHKGVQHRKVQSLGLYERVKRVFITHRFGRSQAKPSPYCFQKICVLEKVAPEYVVYIGDNPQKDFVGIKPLGFKTVRVRQGMHQYVRLSPEYEAHITISSLAELTSDNLEKWFFA